MDFLPPAVIRQLLRLCQYAHADLLSASVRTVQEWEQGRRRLSGPAAALLRIAEQEPEAFLQIRQFLFVKPYYVVS